MSDQPSETGAVDLPPFPVDDVMLNHLEHAMQGALARDESGEPTLVGSDFSMTDLLDFMSAHDHTKDVLIEGPSEVDRALGIERDEWWDETEGGSFYTRDDVIRALIAEVRRLRAGGDHGE